MENFVKAQKQFLDVIAEETAKATGGKHTNGAGKKMKQTELSDLARKATESFMEAQKRLVDSSRAAGECQRENRRQEPWNSCGHSRLCP